MLGESYIPFSSGFKPGTEDIRDKAIYVKLVNCLGTIVSPVVLLLFVWLIQSYGEPFFSI